MVGAAEIEVDTRDRRDAGLLDLRSRPWTAARPSTRISPRVQAEGGITAGHRHGAHGKHHLRPPRLCRMENSLMQYKIPARGRTSATSRVEFETSYEDDRAVTAQSPSARSSSTRRCRRSPTQSVQRRRQAVLRAAHHARTDRHGSKINENSLPLLAGSLPCKEKCPQQKNFLLTARRNYGKVTLEFQRSDQDPLGD